MIVLILSRIHRYVALSLVHAMQALHILGSLPCVRELQCPQTKRRTFWVQLSGALSITSLGNGGPAPSLSAVAFFVNFNSGATICHGVQHKPSQFVDSQASLNVCLVQLLPRTKPFLASHKNAPVSIMMTNEDSLSHAACKRADTIFSNFTKPNFLSKSRPLGFLHLRPVLIISLVLPSLPILILFMTCAANQEANWGNGLSSAIRTLVFCSVVSSLTAISTRPLPCDHPQVVPAESLPLLHMRRSTHLGVVFVLGSLSHSKMILRKPRSVMKPTRNGMDCPVGPFRSQHVAPVLTISDVSANQNWKRVCIVLCQNIVIESYDRSRPFSFPLLPIVQFTNTSAFDTSSTPTPVDSMS